MATFADHFSGRAREYALYRPDYPESLFRFLARESPDRRRAWDCATGSGQAALGLAGHFTGVLATDASIHQVSNAARHPRIRYAVSAAEEAPLESASISLAAAAQALHWFDRARFWEEARRVLVPGGLLAIWSYHGFHVTPDVEAVLHRFYRDIVGPYWPPERALVERGYRDLEFPFEPLETPALLLEKFWDLEAVAGYLRTWSATQRYEAAVGRDPVGLIRHDLEAAWGAPGRVRAFRWDLDLRVGRKS